MMRLKRYVTMLAAASLLLVSSVLPGNAQIAQYARTTLFHTSFEEDPENWHNCGAECFYSFGAPGWQHEELAAWPDIGVFKPSPATMPVLIDGRTVAFNNGGRLWKTLLITPKAGVTYTMSLAISCPANQGPGGCQGGATLVIGNKRIPAVGEVPAPGIWRKWSATYEAQPTDQATATGIAVELWAPGWETLYDAVQIDMLVPVRP